MGYFKVQGSNCCLADDPVFFAAPHNPEVQDGGRSNHKCVVVGMVNLGTAKGSGKEITAACELEFWGGYAEVAACQLHKGSKINIVDGDLKSYLYDTGVAAADGNTIKYQRHSIRVNKFEFAGSTYKELLALVNANLQAAKSQGLIDPDANVTAEFLLADSRPKTVNFDRSKVANGRFGHAKVWDRVTGAWMQGANAPVPAANDEVAELRRQVEELRAAAQNREVGESAPENGAPAEEVAVAGAEGEVNPDVNDDDNPF